MSLNDDTLSDKLVRFAIGAMLGAATAWFLAIQWDVADGRSFVRLVVAGALLTGGLAAALGNTFIERFIRGHWWD